MGAERQTDIVITVRHTPPGERSNYVATTRSRPGEIKLVYRDR